MDGFVNGVEPAGFTTMRFLKCVHTFILTFPMLLEHMHILIISLVNINLINSMTWYRTHNFAFEKIWHDNQASDAAHYRKNLKNALNIHYFIIMEFPK